MRRRALRPRAERRQLVAVETEVREELVRLRARLPHLAGALVATTDGLLLAHEAESVEAEGTAALTAAALGVAQRLADATGQGGFRELLVRGEHGYVACYAAGPSAVLTVTAGPRTNVGRLHLEARRSGERIAAVVAGALERPAHP
ncbi:roadblock/LC7 domain-containing protein [Streptomyces sp. NPDC059740]|uniref:roadblock/LC7 domain-containing protein n=1 Tax=Streptomyces sp. NPDC059740 TaxID=3346926 RepID=UPI003666DF1B